MSKNNDNAGPDKTVRAQVADKTMRAQVADKTVRAQVADKTVRADAEKTQRPPVGAEKTLNAAIIDKTQRPQGAAARQKNIEDISRGYEESYVLNGVTYRTVKVLSSTSGEALVLLVENSGKQYALKLYYYGQHPDHDILETIHRAHGSGLLIDVIAHGMWTNPKRNDEQRDFELMTYCTGGSLDKVSLKGDEAKLREIAIQAAAAIDFLDQHKILHRDIKPGNFFFTDETRSTLVLGDFGIAQKLSKDGTCEVDDVARTPIYACPEIYVPRGLKAQLTVKSDYYSLGITLMSLWMGEAQLAGNESALLNNKRNDSLQYPSDMSAHTLSLIKALTRLAPNKRCNFEEIIRWAQGESIFEETTKDDAEIKAFKVVYNAGKNQIAHTAEELAQFMLTDKELAKKYLYTGKLTKWLNEAQRPELAMNVEHIVEKLYPADQEAGLYATCYMLDPEMPYVDIRGKQISTAVDIAGSLIDNAAYYRKALANPNDSLYIFLDASGEKSISVKFPQLFKKDSRRALWRLIYALDPGKPFYIVSEENKTIPCNTIDDVLVAVYNNIPDNDTWDDMRDELFLEWLAHRDPAIAGKVRSSLKDAKVENQSATWCVLYNLNPKASYTLQLDETADDYYFTHSQVANYINLCLLEYLCLDTDPASIIRNLTDIRYTRLYYYFKSKGIYDDKIDIIEYCMDTESKDNVKKSGPYSWIYGAFKAIKALNSDPYYYFKDSDIVVTSLDDLKKVPSKEVKYELEEGYLRQWLATFFQEDPFADLSPKFAYEKLTQKYVEYIERLDNKCVDVINYRKATNIVNDNLRSVRSSYRWLTIMKVVLGILCFVPIVAFIVALAYYGFPFDGNPLDGLKSTPFIVLAVIFSFCMWVIQDFENIIGSVIVGAIGAAIAYGVIYFAIEFIMPAANWICIGILVILMGYLISRCYINLPSNRSKHKHLFKPGFEERVLEPLHFTYRADDGSYFDSSIADESVEYASYLKDNIKSLSIRAIPSIIIVAVLGYFFVRYTEELNIFSGGKIDTVSAAPLQGAWEGTFEGRPATLNITALEGDQLQAEITVQYSNRITEQLQGIFNQDSMAIRFDDVNRNGNLDGFYTIKVGEEMNTLEGTYENYISHKQVNVSFSK